MKKDITSQILERISQKEDEKNAIRRETAAKLAEYDRTIKELTAKLETIKDPAEYRETVKQLNDAKEDKSFYLMHSKRGTGEKPILSEAEHKAITDDITAAIADLQTEAAPKIDKALNDFVEIYMAYADEVEKLEQYQARADILRLGRRLPKRSRISDIINICADKFGYLAAIMQPLTYQTAAVKAVYKAVHDGEKIPTGEGYEVKKIYQTITEGRDKE